jgi:hypothetical protein
MEAQQLRKVILDELPILMQNNTAFRDSVLQITRVQFADKAETESRFDSMMKMLERKIEEDRQMWQESKQHREENERRWQENERRWQKNERRWEESRLESKQRWEENERRWEENRIESKQRWEESRLESKQRWVENERRWEKSQQESQQRWEENQKEIVALTNAIQEQNKKIDRKYDQTIGALGTRWGLHSEASFRNALAGILKDFQGVEVININEYDDEGIVFGHPDQIELDIIIKNGVLIICEIKSSINKADMYAFVRKVRFYEQKHARKANRMIVISPMLDRYAKPVADKLGIEVYSYAEGVEL